MSNLLGTATPLPTWGKASATAEECVREFVKTLDKVSEGEGRPVNLSAFPSKPGAAVSTISVVAALRKAIDNQKAAVRVSVREGVVYLAPGTMTKRPRLVAAKTAPKKKVTVVEGTPTGSVTTTTQ